MAGLAIDCDVNADSGDEKSGIALIKRKGKVKALEEEIQGACCFSSSARPLTIVFTTRCILCALSLPLDNRAGLGHARSLFVNNYCNYSLNRSHSALLRTGHRVRDALWHCTHTMGDTRRAELDQHSPTALRRCLRWSGHSFKFSIIVPVHV